MRSRWRSSGDGTADLHPQGRSAAEDGGSRASWLARNARQRRGRRSAEPLQGQGRPAPDPPQRETAGVAPAQSPQRERRRISNATGRERLPPNPACHNEQGRHSAEARHERLPREAPLGYRLPHSVRQKRGDQRIWRLEPTAAQLRRDNGFNCFQLLAGIHAEIDLGSADIGMPKP
jgi:hypothetical protein